MTAKYKIGGVDCPVCAIKTASEIEKVDGVKKADINFIRGKMTVEIEGDNKDIDKKVLKAAKRVSPDFEMQPM